MRQKRYYLSVCIWFQEWAHLGRESTVSMHPQLRLFTLQLFLDFRAIVFPRIAPHFFGHHDSLSNLAESRYPHRVLAKLPLVVKPLLYCTRKCDCKVGCVSASCFLQPPRNVSTGHVPVLEHETFSRTLLGTPRTCTRCS